MTDLRIKSKAEEKLSRIRPGRWRNRWRVFKRITFTNGQAPWEPGEILWGKYISAERAEQKAIEWEKSVRAQGHDFDARCKYLGPVFFPDDGGGQ